MTEMEKIKNYIGGELVEPHGQKYLDNVNPATGEKYSLVPDSDEHDVHAAVKAAKEAFVSWSGLSAHERANYLRKISFHIEKNLEELARIESIDTGKPIKVARLVDLPRAVKNFKFFADAIEQHESESFDMPGEAFNYTLREPLGVVGTISPWNLPLYLLSWKIAPALAAGNTVVAKPSEVTPATAYELAKICRAVGLPKGVLNIVHGLGGKVGTAITNHRDVKAISFTGSTRTGAEIAKTAAAQFKKVSLEMGGKNPTLVFADCDFDLTVDNTVRAAFANQGQVCLCGSRIFVERLIYDKFKAALIAKTENLVVGDPLDEKTDQGSLVSKMHFEKVLSCIDLAKTEGGKILTGGKKISLGGKNQNGFFVSPTLIEGLGASCRTNQEEIFGPVATLMPFDTESEVVEAANGTQYGLAASLWTRDEVRAKRVAAQMAVGVVWINCWMVRDVRTPFGGVKASGMGREGGRYALDFFTEAKNVCVKY